MIRTFVIVPVDDGEGYEIRVDPALPDGTVLAHRPTYDEAAAQAVLWARRHGGGISKTRSRH